MADYSFQQCIMPSCAARYEVSEVLFGCRTCGALLDIRYDWSRVPLPGKLSFFDARRGDRGWRGDARINYSGVWRFRELLPLAPAEDLVSIGEGQTALQRADQLATFLDMKPGRLFLQYEGFNPSGSFKDNGMAAAFTIARRLDRPRVACASTGNTSASLAMFAGQTTTRGGKPMQAVVFIGDEKIAYGKLSQALDYGARTLQVAGDFDDCMRLVREAADKLGLYLMNSVNPFRLEGQKAIMYRVLEGLNWEVPDWIVVPGGNLGNSSAFGKAFTELLDIGLIDRLPRLAIINAQGANTLYELVEDHGVRFEAGKPRTDAIDTYFSQMAAEGRRAQTVASAIEIGRPVNLLKALRSLEALNGVVREVDDTRILDGKALVGRYGYGCEPASGASVAGLRQLLDEKIIDRDERVVCILTGHGLKDPNATVDYHRSRTGDDTGGNVAAFAHANAPIRIPPTLDAVQRALA